MGKLRFPAAALPQLGATASLSIHGGKVVDRINFDRGRIKPLLSMKASAGADVYKRDRLMERLQADGENLNGRLNLIDLGGLFSGSAIAPSRSYFLRLVMAF